MNLFGYACLFLVVGGLMGCGGGVSSLHGKSSGLVNHLNSSTVALVATSSKGEVRSYCTGVWVSEDLIVTATHCVKGAQELALGAKASDDEDESYSNSDLDDVKVHYIIEKEVDEVGTEPTGMHLSVAVLNDKDHDVSLLRAVGNAVPGHDVAKLAMTGPGVGERVHVVGQVKGLYWSYVEGVVSAYRKELPESRTPHGNLGPFVQVSAAVYYGNSGGGVFDNDGNLVGVASFLGGAPNTTMFAHVDSVRSLLTTYRNKK